MEIDEKPKEIIEINSADSGSLLKINGIGPYYAHKIIEYRKQLGGYKKAIQLMEIWNFDSIRFGQINPQINVDTVLIKKLDINSASIEELKKHPYIRWYLANAIVKYRQQHGAYSGVIEVKKVALMTDSIYIKLSPYLIAE